MENCNGPEETTLENAAYDFFYKAYLLGEWYLLLDELLQRWWRTGQFVVFTDSRSFAAGAWAVCAM